MSKDFFFLLLLLSTNVKYTHSISLMEDMKQTSMGVGTLHLLILLRCLNYYNICYTLYIVIVPENIVQIT